MNRTDRLVAMVMHLQGRRVVRAEELAGFFEISVRTVYRDIQALSEAGVPVVGEAGVGYSLVKGYHLPPVMLTSDEAMALFVGGEMVKHYTDASLAAPVALALLKIRSVLPRERQDDVDQLARSVAFAGGSSAPGMPDQRILLPVQHAIISRRVLRITYRGRARRTDTKRDIEPLGVTFYGGVWYLVAWCRLRSDFRHFRLDRFVSLEVLPTQFRARPDFSLDRHLADAEARVEMLPATVWFSDAVVDRAARESYGGIAQKRVTHGGVEAEMRTYSYDWLARWILSFGGEAEILAPESARLLLLDQARQAASRHRGKHS